MLAQHCPSPAAHSRPPSQRFSARHLPVPVLWLPSQRSRPSARMRRAVASTRPLRKSGRSLYYCFEEQGGRADTARSGASPFYTLSSAQRAHPTRRLSTSSTDYGGGSHWWLPLPSLPTPPTALPVRAGLWACWRPICWWLPGSITIACLMRTCSTPELGLLALWTSQHALQPAQHPSRCAPRALIASTRALH